MIAIYYVKLPHKRQKDTKNERYSQILFETVKRKFLSFKAKDICFDIHI